MRVYYTRARMRIKLCYIMAGTLSQMIGWVVEFIFFHSIRKTKKQAYDHQCFDSTSVMRYRGVIVV